MKKFFLFSMLAFFAVSGVAAEPALVAGKQYVVVAEDVTKGKQQPILVQEFFSYGCPHCYHLEPQLKKWLANKSKDIAFERVPVMFNKAGRRYARAYYVAKSMNKDAQVSQAMFQAIHDKKQYVSSDKDIEALFLAQGVSADDFKAAYFSSPTIDMQLKRADQLAGTYKIYTIPEIVIAGKYKTTPSFFDGDRAQMFRVIDKLIAKAREEIKPQ